MDGMIAAPPARIPVEYVGRARAFVRAVRSESSALQNAVQQFVKDVRYCGVRGFRQPRTPDVLRKWKAQAPQGFLIHRNIPPIHNNKLSIYELRITSQDHRAPHWAEDSWEPGVLLDMLLLSSHDPKSLRRRSVAAIGLHGLARWYQRTGLVDDSLLIRDLTPCAVTLMDAMKAQRVEDITVECERGQWKGRIGMTLWEDGDGEAEPVFLARTFLHKDEV